MEILPADFYARETCSVARDLIGMVLVHDHPAAGRISGYIVETEAYHHDDPACHAWHLFDRETGTVRLEGRGAGLFEAPGTAYVYLNYGMYWLLNVVTEREGVGAAVLIRGVEPREGLDFMRAQRPKARRPRDLTNGPGKLGMAFGLDDRHHGRPMTAPPLYIARPETVPSYAVDTSSRIGISRGVDLQWRYFVPGNPYVSPGTPSDRVKRTRR